MEATASDAGKAVKREPWARFFVKVAMVLVVLYAAGSMFATRYKVGITSQLNTCIPGYRFFLIDTQNMTPERDAIFAFRAKGITPLLEKGHKEIQPLIPYFADGEILVKYIRGIPGDEVSVSTEEVSVNDEVINKGLALAMSLNKKKEDFVRKRHLDEGQFWFAGSTFDSFDSRYWGSVTSDQLIGRAYPLF